MDPDEQDIPVFVQAYAAKTPMPQRRTRFGAAVFNDQIWVIGGYDNVAGSGERFGTAVPSKTT